MTAPPPFPVHPSPCLSVVVNIPDNSPAASGSPKNVEGLIEHSKRIGIYLSLTTFKIKSNHGQRNSEALDQSSEVDLEEEAARYEEGKYAPDREDPLACFSRPRPPPYILPALPALPINTTPFFFLLPALLPLLPTPVIQELAKSKATLEEQIGGLKQVVQL